MKQVEQSGKIKVWIVKQLNMKELESNKSPSASRFGRWGRR
jgi:hypothetical protein